MAQHKTSEYGVVPLLIMAVLGVVLVVAAGSWYLATRSDSKADKKPIGATGAELPKNNSGESSGQSVIQLDHKTVRVSLPEKWTYMQGTDECPASVTADVVCLEGATITPGVQLPTRYGDGTEYFHIQAGVFGNADHRAARDWLIKDFDDGETGGQDITRSTTINGHEAYYRKKKMSGDSTTIEEISYVFSKGDRAVLIRARTYEPGTLADGQRVGDFRQFEPEIDRMAQSLAIDP